MASSTSTGTSSSSPKTPSIYIGCAGYSYAHWRKGVFYPNMVKQAEELNYYSTRLASCEINNTFHQTPTESTFQKWAHDSTKGFVFALKVSQDVTHIKRLEGIEEYWEFFTTRVLSCLGPKLGPVLFQLPPNFKRDDVKLTALGELVSKTALRVAVEFRNSDWYVPEVFSIMRKYNLAICENVTPDNSFPYCGEVTANFTYSRYHKREGGNENTVTNYEKPFLEEKAKFILDRRAKNVDQYIYFLNDIEGRGPNNASELQKILEKLVSPAPLVTNWKASAVQKGGKGSLESFFKRGLGAKAKPEENPAPLDKPLESEAKKVKVEEVGDDDVEIVDFPAS